MPEQTPPPPKFKSQKGSESEGEKENVWSIDNDTAKAAAEKEKGTAKHRRRKRNRSGRIMVSGAMLMEVETVLQTQHVGSNRIKEHKDGNVSLPQNHMDDVVTSHILSDFESFDFELSDLLEEDVMGIEPGLVFFEDGSYSRGPVNIQVVDVDDSKYYLTPTFKFQQVQHDIDLEFSLKPFSHRKHIQPLKLTGSWKVFEVNATPVFGDEMDGILCIGVGWYSDEGTKLVMERDYGLDGMLKEVRWKSEVKRWWSDPHLV
ncbi:hypothetical protein GH714_000117 [Hevea brasiliensis]|uniref:Uncharacterized protein n=1 Tax=Hevea brasiliensis TaxID=3981 RepID=A0A6A6KUZ6_HEVBR|nr:hypothetical protein GH714_000117 [Hevea brasiliensis]